MSQTDESAQRLGLTSAEAAERTARGEGNRVHRDDRAEYLSITLRNILTLFNALVAPAAVALFLLHEYGDALAVSGMALTNLFLGLVQEIRAKRHLDRLTLLAEARVRVLRDGCAKEISSGDVVRGDLLLLAAGDTVVADGTVVEARFLEIDEALLTGESDPVPRHPGEQVLSGSFCVAGEGSYLAERVGVESFVQRTAGEARSYRYSSSPVQHSINRLLALLSAAAVLLCLGYLPLYRWGGLAPNDLWKMIAATITSMVPQGLVVMTTFAFVLGAVRMSRRGALVQVISAVESMASVDTLCMDKTGTLTTNRLHLEKLIPLDESMPHDALRERLSAFASASLDRSNKSLVALRDAVGEVPVQLLDQLPFKSQNRYSAVRVSTQTGEYVLVLGACEALRACLESTNAWEKKWHDLLASGLRVLLFAEATDPPASKFTGSLDGFALRPLALLALSDELRPEARQVLEDLSSQGISFKILSGDHTDTVRATVAPLFPPSPPAPLPRNGGEGGNASPLAPPGGRGAGGEGACDLQVVSGDELQVASDPDELIRTRCVFGRVAPAQKVQIVTALKKHGRHVAMIGDGVNDVLPIKNAHVGIAMGDGASATKHVAGVVLETNDFSLLPETLAEGRTILRNLRRAGKLFLVKNVFTLILIVGALRVFGLPFPYLPRQVTLLNFLTIGAPAFFIMLDRRRSTTASAAHFIREVGGFALRTGVVLGLSGLLLLWLSKYTWHDDETTQRTLLLSLLVLLGLTTLQRALTEMNSTFAEDSRFRWLAVTALAIYLGSMYCPLVGKFFELTPLSFHQWGRLLPLAAGAYLSLRLSDS
jgi:cation-transporting ATPase E